MGSSSIEENLALVAEEDDAIDWWSEFDDKDKEDPLGDELSTGSGKQQGGSVNSFGARSGFPLLDMRGVGASCCG